jgi:WD40 repeat protein
MPYRCCVYDWDPFDENMLASASKDGTIKIRSGSDDWEPQMPKMMLNRGLISVKA